MESETLDSLGVLAFIVIVALIIYFIPAMIAEHREHRNKRAILVVNFFFGWTLLGWVGALVWAIYKEKENPQESPSQDN